jgi:cellulose synthase/poly-beta-1,6-N-acetylglucosamine synthase-like glycosyltransferase
VNRQSRPRTTTLALLLVAATGPVLYPLWLARRTRHLSEPEPPEPRQWPGISVIIPAYREREVIAAKVENVFENEYPGPVEVIVVADDPDTGAAARRTAARVLDGHERSGKASALNLGVSGATMPFVVLTDANAMLDRDGLQRLVRWLDDPTIGAVTGEKRIRGGRGEGMYWAFESWLKQREFRIGTTVGVCGELVALRRADYKPLPADIAVDDLWLALDVSEQGRRIAYEPSATVHEEASGSASIEWERRTRIVSGALDAMWKRRDHLVPGASPVTPQLWGHRLIRSSLGPAAHGLLFLRAVGAMRRSTIARLFVLVHAVGVRAIRREEKGEALSGPERVLAHVLFLQAVGLGGTVRWLRGDRPAVWPKEERAPITGERDADTHL